MLMGKVHRATVTDAEGHPLDIEVVEGGV